MPNPRLTHTRAIPGPTGPGGSGGPPGGEPLGLLIARTAKAVERAFDETLVAAGGSRPTWLILLAVVTGAGTSQAALAARVGITGPTLVHHLDRLETAGLVDRRLDADNRRIRSLALTPAGRELFGRLRTAAGGFDARLHHELSEADAAALRRALNLVRDNVTDTPVADGSHRP